MQKQSVFLVAALSALTVVYYVYWLVMTKRQMIRLRADIPPSYYVVIPGVHLYWLYKYLQAAKQITKGQINDSLIFGIQVAFTVTWLSLSFLLVWLSVNPESPWPFKILASHFLLSPFGRNRAGGWLPPVPLQPDNPGQAFLPGRRSADDALTPAAVINQVLPRR